MQNFFAIGAGEEPNLAYEERLGIKGLNVAPFLAKYGVQIADKEQDQAPDFDTPDEPGL